MNSFIKKCQRVLPALAFVGGFTWDSLTLGQLVRSSDLLLLLLYYLLALLFLLLLSSSSALLESFPENRNFKQRIYGFILGRDFSFTWKNRFSYVVQFCFGSLFSALVVCYFKSSGSLVSLFFVLALAVLLVLNEFFQKRYESFSLSLAFFSLLGTMFFNFLIPHLVDRIGFFWFLVSVAVSFGLCFFAWKLSAKKSKKHLVAPIVISVFLTLAYLMNWIPPVPLVLKEQMPCLHFSKDYSCQISTPSFLERYSLKAPVVKKMSEDGSVYFLSSVFAPSKIQVPLEHRWFLLNQETNNFELKDKISSSRMTTKGSREEGFRIYTRKKNVPAGYWKVETALKEGAVIGSKEFLVEDVDSLPKRILWKMK